jgi:uncharacterized membrane protein YfcA
MELTHIIGYIGAVFTGFVLGLLGGGGALLAIPVLVYLFKIDASVATGYSLFLVGIAALSGAYQNIRKKLVDYNAALYYGIPSVVAVFTVRRFVMPNLPAVILQAGGYTIDKNHFILIILSVVMVIAAYKMITSGPTPEESPHQVDHISLAFYAVLIGGFLGLVGAGGGFLMVPALIYFANLSPKKAIGTSLVLVAVNSFIGFIGDISTHEAMDWKFLISFAACSIVGVYAGHYMAGRIHNDKLKKYFGWFILVVAIYIVAKETIAK